MSTRYLLKLETARELRFEVPDNSAVDPAGLNPLEGIPDWVRLECEQCPGCPFATPGIRYCPAAFDLQDVISQCSDLISYDRVEISRETDSGAVTTQTDLQKALFAVIGERAISSACPVLNTRRWALDYYSMITSAENIFFRSLASYLVRQFLLASVGREPDFELKNHVAFLEETGIAFSCLLERFRNVVKEDASNNAVVRMIFMVRRLTSRRDHWIEELKIKAGV